MKLAYHIASTTAPFARGLDLNTVAGRHSGKAFGICLNVPVAAKDTLLAQQLRTGKFAGYIPDRGVRPMTPINPTTAFDVAKKKLVGKLLGVEIEYYPKAGTSVARRTSLTRVHGDGSLTNGYGQEINKVCWQSPAGRLEGLLALNIEGRVDKTCGLHVHVDARHLGKDGLLTVEETYDKLEKLAARFLKQLVPPSRRANKYCKFRNNRLSGNRYAAVNFQSYAEHGTIEFRCAAGSTNVRKIEAWALLCQYLLNWCAVPTNKVNCRWLVFVKTLPPRLQNWVILRHAKLNNNLGEVEGDLSASALEND